MIRVQSSELKLKEAVYFYTEDAQRMTLLSYTVVLHGSWIEDKLCLVGGDCDFMKRPYSKVTVRLTEDQSSDQRSEKKE